MLMTPTRLHQHPDNADGPCIECPQLDRTTADQRDRTRTAYRRLGFIFAAAGLITVPWLFYLGASLPIAAEDAHWALGWVGLDSCEALALLTPGLLLLRADNRCALASVATAVLLLIDAWFDITSAASGSELATAIVMAVCAEIPIAAACAG